MSVLLLFLNSTSKRQVSTKTLKGFTPFAPSGPPLDFFHRPAKLKENKFYGGVSAMKDPRSHTFGVSFLPRCGEEHTDGRVNGIDAWLVRKFLQAIGEPPLRVVLWDGKEIARPASTAAVGMVIRDRASLWRLFTNPLLHFGDDYCAGRIEIEGGLVAFMETVYLSMAHTPRFRRSSDPAA